MGISLINHQVALAAKANREGDWPPEFVDAYNAAWSTIDEVNDIIGRLNKPVFDLDKENLEIVFLMLFNSLSDIMAAVYTITSGWIRPSVTTLRGAIETIGTAVVVHHDPKMMEQFKAGKLKIPGDILRKSTQFLPSLARLYGALTKEFTHETFNSTSRSINLELGELMLIPRICIELLPLYLNVFVEAVCLTQMLGIALEICFPGLTGVDTYFAAGSDGTRCRRPALSDEAIKVVVAARESAQKAYSERASRENRSD